MSSRAASYPPPRRHTVLVLPFTASALAEPTILLPVIFSALVCSSYESLTILFSTPQASAPSPNVPLSSIESTTTHPPSDSAPAAAEASASSPQLYEELKADPVTHWSAFQAFLGKVYATLAAAQWRCGRVLMRVEVHFNGEDGDWGFKLPPREEAQTIVLDGFESLFTGRLGSATLPEITSCIPFPQRAILDPPLATVPLSTSDPIGFSASPISPTSPSAPVAVNPGLPTVAVGGTFDHLHAAHKLLLHLSLFLTTRRLIVGIMSDSLLSSKSNAPLVETLPARMQAVKDYLIRCGPGDVELDVVEIHDPLGPTAWDEDIQGLVVSGETRSGGEMVNRTRRDKGLDELKVFVVDVIASSMVAAATATATAAATTSATKHDATHGEDEEGVEETDERDDDDDDEEEEEQETGEGADEETVRPRGRAESTSVQTLDLSSELDEARLKALKLGSTAIRQWIAERSSQGDEG